MRNAFERETESERAIEIETESRPRQKEINLRGNYYNAFIQLRNRKYLNMEKVSRVTFQRCYPCNMLEELEQVCLSFS